MNTGGNVLNPSTAGSSTTVTFDGSGLVLPKGTTKSLSLKCDIKTGVTAEYYWGLSSTDITSVSGLTSGQTIAETSVTSAGRKMTAAANGAYTVRDEGALTYRIARAGASDVVLGRLVFTASEEEDVTVVKIAFEMGSTTLNSASDLIGEKVTIWDSSTKVGEAAFSTGGLSADYATSTLSTGVTGVFIPKGKSKTLTIKADLRDHDSTYLSHPGKVGVTSGTENEPGQFIQIRYDGDNNGLNGNYARGAGSGATINGSSADASPEGVRIFANYPMIEACGMGLTCQATLNTGTVYSVKVTAVNEDIAIGRMSFDILTNFTDDAARTFKLLGPNGFVNNTAVATTTKSRGADTAPEGSDASVGAAGRRLTIDFDDASTNIDRFITAGGSKTYHLQIQSLPVLSVTNTESMNIRLLADTAYATSSDMGGPLYPRVDCYTRVAGTSAAPTCGISGNLAGDTGYAASGTDRFIWSPNSTSSPTEPFAEKKGRRDWTNGYGVPGYPALASDMPVHTVKD